MNKASREFISCLYYNNKESTGMKNGQNLRDRLAIPLIGPIPRSTPLIVGASLELNSPTPLQWRSIEESVVTYLERNKGGEATTIHGAPIVALIDDVSGKELKKLDAVKIKGRFATIAAVIGSGASTCLSKSFMDSVARMTQYEEEDSDLYLGGSIRFIGIGRAELTNLYYKVPTKMNKDYNEYENYETCSSEAENMPIIMAEFTILHDNGIRTDKQWSYGNRSRQVSPVHAMNELNSAANRAEWMHSERKKLIAGVKAGKARLDNIKLEITEAGLKDYDGLGMLAGFDNAECITEGNEDIKFRKTESYSNLGKEMNQPQSVEETQKVESSPSEIFFKMENYGLSYISGFSTLAELTYEAMEVLDPYYSPEFKDREAYWFEVFGFVAWRALEGFATPEQIAWALRCRSSSERLEKACELLMEHRMLLKDLASEVNQELQDYGEDFVDLW